MTDKKQREEPTGDPGASAADGGWRSSDSSPADELVTARTRTASLFVAAAATLVLALLMLVFVLQNGQRQAFEFLWFDFTLPAGAALLLAAVVGGLTVASLGLGRVVQLRLAARRHRDVDRRRSR